MGNLLEELENFEECKKGLKAMRPLPLRKRRYEPLLGVDVVGGNEGVFIDSEAAFDERNGFFKELKKMYDGSEHPLIRDLAGEALSKSESGDYKYNSLRVLIYNHPNAIIGTVGIASAIAGSVFLYQTFFGN
jgi:hypothetical protein